MLFLHLFFPVDIYNELDRLISIYWNNLHFQKLYHFVTMYYPFLLIAEHNILLRIVSTFMKDTSQPFSILVMWLLDLLISVTLVSP